MSDIFRLGGILLITLSAYLVSRGYSAFLDRRESETEGFFDLLLHIERELGLSLSSGRELWRGFENEALCKSGLLPLLKEGVELPSAFAECRKRLMVSAECEKILLRFFSDFGRDYKDGELKRIAMAKEELSKLLCEEKTENKKNKRVVGAIAFGFAASAAILLI